MSGLSIGLAFALYLIFKNLRYFAASSVIIVLTLSCLTFLRTIVWSDQIVFWKDIVKKAPLKSRNHQFLAEAFFKKNLTVKALDAYNKAIELDPTNPHFYLRRGFARRYFRNASGHKDIEGAIADYNLVYI